ncbi:MAG: YdcF family protein [Spirulina sp. SIO3F2]|nr:YdcF family protein [Spirulina sp. SIO3F2]
MFQILSAILLLIVVLLLVWYLMAKVIPKQAFLILGIAFVLAILVVNFFAPDQGFPAELWDIVSVPLKPFGLALFLIFMALLKIKKGTIEKPGPVMLWLAFGLIFLSSQPGIAYELTQRFEQEAVKIEIKKDGLCNEDECKDDEKLQNVGAIALLGRGTTEAPIPYRTQIQLTDSGDRILYTDLLYDQQRVWGRTPIVVVCAPRRSGLSGGDDSQRNEAEDISQLLQRLGVPKNQIELRGDAKNLHQSARAVQDVLKSKDLMERPVILVTSGIQMRRAAQTFRKLNMKVIARPSDFYTFEKGSTPKRNLTLQDFLPSLHAYEMTNAVIEEYLATIYYFLRGWLSPVVY